MTEDEEQCFCMCCTDSISRKNCYIVSAGDLQNRYSAHEESGKRMTPGLLIGCHVDTSTGLLTFTVNGQEAANKFQVTQLILAFLPRAKRRGNVFGGLCLSVCVSVCLCVCVCDTITFENHDLESRFLVCNYILRACR